MSAIEINRIPHQVLKQSRAGSAVILATGESHLSSEGGSEDDRGQVLVATSRSSTEAISPEGLESSAVLGLDLTRLERCRLEEGVHSIMLAIAKLDESFMLESTRSLSKRYLVLSELKTLEQFGKTVYVVYAVTHYNPGQKPLGPLTVNIGGDCYRTGDQIRDLSSILDRTRNLAEAMLKKAVMIFPDIPALHGGKKGEWIILDEDGQKIEGLSEEAIISVGSAIIPQGINFLNRYKERQASAAGILSNGAYPKVNYVLPDSGSPDVLSGIFWRGEYPDKYINMCDAWNHRGFDMRSFTCLPVNLGGTRDPSSRPTGHGVATTTLELADRHPDLGIGARSNLRFLLEAAGGVGDSTVEALLGEYGIPPHNITVFDRSVDACASIQDKYGVQTITLRHTDFYEKRLKRVVEDEGGGFDVWINNGEGNNTKPHHVRELLGAGVRVFTGGANNYLEVETQEESLDAIFTEGGWAWPDAATSGGGWTLAVIDIMTRCQGKESSTQEIQQRILETIANRNRQLVRDVLGSLPEGADGRAIWERVSSLIEERKEKTLGLELSKDEIFAAADTSRWNLSREA